MQTQIPRPITAEQFQLSQSRWRAITRRTPSSHSSFLYGVKSTKIYCRPTCPARLARRANVVFYDTEAQALRDGFRPCKRCQPDNANFVGEGEAVITRILSLLQIKRGDLTMKPGLKKLAQEVGVTPSYLCRVFKKTMGITLGAYMTEFERNERNVSDHDTESPAESPSTVRPGVVDAPPGPLTPAPIVRSPATSEVLEQRVGNAAEAMDLNFNFDKWFQTEGFTQDDFWNEDSLNEDRGVTRTAYMEFERDASDCKPESSIGSPGTLGPGVVDPATGFLTPASTARSPAAPAVGPKGQLAEQQVGDAAEALDLNFNFDDWLRTGGFIQQDFIQEGFWNEDFWTEGMNDGLFNEDVYMGSLR